MGTAAPPHVAPDVRWEQLIDSLLVDLDRLNLDFETRAHAELSSYLDIPSEDLRPVTRRDGIEMLERLRAGLPPTSSADRSVYYEAGFERAQQGITLSDLLQAWRISLDGLCSLARDRVPDDADRDSTLLRFFELAMSWTDFGMMASADGYQTAQAQMLRRTHHFQGNLVRGILLGDMASDELHDGAIAYGIDPTASHHAVRFGIDDPATTAQIERYLHAQDGTRRNALVALIDGDLCGVVRRLPPGPAPAIGGVSAAVPLREMKAAFREATRAAETAQALERPGLHDLGSLGVFPAVLRDHEVGAALVDRHVRPLLGRGKSHQAVLDTVLAYVDNHCRLEQTARVLYVHVNTVKYRLGRFEELTGQTVDDPEVLIGAWWAIHRYRAQPSDGSRRRAGSAS